MKLELLAGKSAEEIGAIWNTHFMHKDSLSAVIPAPTYRQMREQLRQYSTVINLTRELFNLTLSSERIPFYL